MTYLRVTVRFLDDRYHGLLDRGGPAEWPPSPFRLFSALVAGVARLGQLDGELGQTLEWLQKLDPPVIITPKSKTGQEAARFVPNNDGDRKLDRQDRLTAKTTIPTHMLLNASEKPEVHYLWHVERRADIPVEGIRAAAGTLTALGWGIDMAFADAMPATQAEVEKIPGLRWYPKPRLWCEGSMLRVPSTNGNPRENTLYDLKHCYQSVVSRIEHGKPLHTVDKPSIFERVFYSSVERPVGRPCDFFKLECQSQLPLRYPQSRFIHLAGMVRHLAIETMKTSPPAGVGSDWVKTYIAGHAEEDAQERRQLSYVPLPSLGHPHTDPSVRRIMIVAPTGDDAWLDHVARRLAGQVLTPVRGDEFMGRERPVLARLRYDAVTDRYLMPATAWASVTPVILPGHDDHKPSKTRKLIVRALQQSRIDQPCEFEWSAFSHFPKSLSAHKYDRNGKLTGYIRPDHLLTQTAVHLRLFFNDGLKVPGPLVIGAGRHCGFGLMAGIDR